MSLTGSEAAGRKVAAIAGRHLKKLVLELGGSDAFVVLDSVSKDAELLVGDRLLDRGLGWYYTPRVLGGVEAGMPACEQELFGPVASIIRARDEEDALRLANDTRFGLGGSVWTADADRGESFARRMACGSAFVNGPGRRGCG